MESEATTRRRNSPARWIVAATVVIQWLGICILALVAGLVLCVSVSIFRGSFLSRPVPSEAEYLSKYMTHFDERQIESIDYVYKGAVGGEATVAVVHFKGPVEVHGAVEVSAYDPAAIAEEPAASEFRERWAFAAGGILPPWFDFPYQQRMRMVWEAREGPNDGEPIYRFEWYIDDQRNMVYFRGVRG